MIISATLSKPASNIESILGKPYIKAKLTTKRPAASPEDKNLQLELFTQKQAFQQNMTQSQAQEFLNLNAGTTFKNTTYRTESEEVTIMANRHGEIRKSRKPLVAAKNNSSKLQMSSVPTPGITTQAKGSWTEAAEFIGQETNNRKKNYLLKEGIPVPFLVKLGVMTKEGKVVASKYDKYRQINRFLEFIKDIIPEVTKQCAPQTEQGQKFTEERPLYIADFGCGKSYLTFAVYYYLSELCGIPVSITGLDLKEDVIKHCQNLALEFNYTNLHFYCGDVAQAKDKYKHSPDIMITLHACDTATDYALNYAVNENTAAILSVPCCQHEINLQLEKQTQNLESPFSTLEHWGILRERFSALATDAIRAELLEQKNYSVQLLEFIDFEGTPKNLLIRAVKKTSTNEKGAENSKKRLNSLLEQLKVNQTLINLFDSDNK